MVDINNWHILLASRIISSIISSCRSLRFCIFKWKPLLFSSTAPVNINLKQQWILVTVIKHAWQFITAFPWIMTTTSDTSFNSLWGNRCLLSEIYYFISYVVLPGLNLLSSVYCFLLKFFGKETTFLLLSSCQSDVCNMHGIDHCL